MNNTKFNKGINLVEVVIGAGLVFIIFSGLISTFNFYLKGAVSVTDNIKAEYLAVEGLEALRFMRDNDFSAFNALPKNTDLYLQFNGTSWQSTTSPEVLDSIYSRSFKLKEVFRDSSGQIASTGTIDSETVLCEVLVTWNDRGNASERRLSTYLTNAVNL